MKHISATESKLQEWLLRLGVLKLSRWRVSRNIFQGVVGQGVEGQWCMKAGAETMTHCYHLE